MSYARVTGVALGAPNVYRASDRQSRRLDPARMDVCAFVGVAPRGPCREPTEPDFAIPNLAYVEVERERQRSVAVAVESWNDYQRLYGGFDGPGRLPYAVASFFEQGGRRAYITRIVHQYDGPSDLEGCARAVLLNVDSSAATPVLEAKNEGSWGNQLRAALGFNLKVLNIGLGSSESELIIDGETDLTVGSLLRLTVVVGAVTEHHLRWVDYIGQRGGLNNQQTERYARFNLALPTPPRLAELIEADFLVADGSGYQERFHRLGLCSDHPRWLAAVIYRESELVNPVDGWLQASLTPQNVLRLPLDPSVEIIANPAIFSGGADRYEDIEHGDFFDSKWGLGDSKPGSGVHALTHLRDLSQLVVPDLYVPEALPGKVPSLAAVSVATAEFNPCVAINLSEQEFTQSEPSLAKLALNPDIPEQLEAIILLQQRVVQLAESLAEFIVLLDVPPTLDSTQTSYWRSHFNCSYAAAYSPWLLQNNARDQRAEFILINPSAIAAGVIAAQEFAHGVPHGPANFIGRNIIKVDAVVTPQNHDRLHPLGINIFLPKPQGVWLSAARTLSLNPHYRQLSVRRLMTLLKRVLLQQMQWLVFEPNHHQLWAEVRHMLRNFLIGLYRQGAFTGATEEEAFFVRCDESLNTQQSMDTGKLVAEIGVAPAQPLEFIVVRLTRGADGTLGMET